MRKNQKLIIKKILQLARHPNGCRQNRGKERKFRINLHIKKMQLSLQRIIRLNMQEIIVTEKTRKRNKRNEDIMLDFFNATINEKNQKMAIYKLLSKRYKLSIWTVMKIITKNS